MSEIIFSAPDADYLASEAARLGFLDEDGSMFIVNGSFSSGGGWFLNIVGTIYDGAKARPGYWGRLRINGTPDETVTFSAAITQYFWDNALNGWTSDGRTLAPDWVANVGAIA